MIRIQVSTAAVERELDDLARKQLPFATAKALNQVARESRDLINRDMTKVFDRVAPFTRIAAAAPATLAARKDSLHASVIIKDAQARYLGLEEEGGVRTPADTLAGGKALVVPTSRAKVNARGSMPKGYVAQLARRAQADAARAAKPTRNGRPTKHDKGIVKFTGSGPDGQGPGGFFMRTAGHHLVRLISFESEAHYKPKFRFRARVSEFAQGRMTSALKEALAHAIASARR